MTFPTVDVGSQASDNPDAQPSRQAAQHLSEYGAVKLTGAFDRTLVERVGTHFSARYAPYLDSFRLAFKRNFQDDPKRAMIPVEVEGPVNDPALYASPGVMEVVKQALGDMIILGELGAVISHPGARSQYVHRDSELLFDEVEVDTMIPPFSLTMVIPLVPMTRENGLTEVWLGTHRSLDRDRVASEEPAGDEAELGSCFLMDARVLHRGGANQSDHVRPIVYMSYQRRWYREHKGYENKPPVHITNWQYEKVPTEHKHLYGWVYSLNRPETFEQRIWREWRRLRELKERGWRNEWNRVWRFVRRRIT